MLSDNPQNEPSVAVLLPCYNEAVTIGKVVRDFRAVLPSATVYVYDNNSTDDTVRIAQAAGAIVRREPRQGKGYVIRAMFEDIDADVYVMADGDDTYPAEDAPRLVERVLGGYDMVIGDRLSSTYFSENKRPFHNVGNVLVRAAINLLFHARISDIMTGYRAFSYRFAKTYPVMSRGFEVETEMTIHCLNNGISIAEVPVQYRDRPEGSVSKLDTMGDGIRVLSTIFRLIREDRPLPFFGGLGLIGLIAGLVLVVQIFFEFWKTGLVFRIPTLVGGGFLMLTGLLLIVTGIILDVLARNERKRFLQQETTMVYLKRRRPAGPNA